MLAMLPLLLSTTSSQCLSVGRRRWGDGGLERVWGKRRKGWPAAVTYIVCCARRGRQRGRGVSVDSLWVSVAAREIRYPSQITSCLQLSITDPASSTSLPPLCSSCCGRAAWCRGERCRREAAAKERAAENQTTGRALQSGWLA